MIKVLIADDQELFSDLLGHMLESSPDIQVIARAGNGNEAAKYAQQLEPDVILMDIHMPICNGLEAISQIRKAGSKTKILVLSSSKECEDVSEAIREGADGYILKSVSKERLILAIQSIHAGMGVMDQYISDFARNPCRFSVKGNKKSTVVHLDGIDVELSEREIDIIRMIIDGNSNEEMAKRLFIAEGRVRNIITEIISKLMLKDRTQLAVFALKTRLVK